MAWSATSAWLQSVLATKIIIANNLCTYLYRDINIYNLSRLWYGICCDMWYRLPIGLSFTAQTAQGLQFRHRSSGIFCARSALSCVWCAVPVPPKLSLLILRQINFHFCQTILFFDSEIYSMVERERDNPLSSA